jgi:hypothetical protein
MNGWRWWLLGLAVVAAMVAASLTAPPAEWTTVVQWATARRAELDRAKTPCPVLAGDPGPGDAGQWYADAQRRGSVLAADGAERLARLRGDPAAWPLTDGDREVLAALAPAVAALRAGARAAVDRRDEPCADCLGLLPVVDALLVAALDPRSEPANAVEALLDALACGIDLTARREPLWQLVGVRCVTVALEAIDDTWIDALPGAPLAADAIVHVVEVLASDAALEPGDLGMRDGWIAWRHGFSVRRSGIARAVVLAGAVQRFERAVPLDAPWPLRQTRLRELVAQDRAQNRDLFVPFLAGIDAGEEDRRRASAALRVLRLAVAVAAGLPLPELADPLAGAPLLATPEGRRVHCRAPSGAAERRVTPRTR